MSSRTDAARYARELLDATWRRGDADRVAEELEAIVAVAKDYEPQVRPLFHPLVPKARKLATVRDFAAKLDLSKGATTILEALAQQDRMHLLGFLTQSFRERLNQRKGVVRARVTTATPLPPDREAALGARLEAVTGRKILLSTRVDPSIVGGVVAEVGSTVYDGSVTGQLARMREKLVENV